jgi:signal transduction histidine kinase
MKEADTKCRTPVNGDPTELSPKELQVLDHLLLDQLPVGIFLKDREGRYIFVNSWFCSLKKAPAKEFVGKTAGEVAVGRWTSKVGEDPEKLKEIESFNEGANHHKLIMQTGSSFESEEHYSGVEGRDQYIHVIKGPLVGSDGTIIGSQGVLLDISQRKRAEAELEQVHTQLIDVSRRAGMAEIATSVLHNVGNVLNSINVSTVTIADRLKTSRGCQIAKVSALMDEHAADLGDFMTKDPKGRQLPVYLKQLGETLAEERTETLDEMASLAKNVDHIKDIIAAQQGYTKVSGVAETVKVASLVEDALKMNASALVRHDIQIFREYEEPPPELTVEKHKVLQILVNLIRNAKQACDETGSPDKRLTVRVSNGGSNGGGHVTITLIDNGIGIPAENLTRVFSHGFTTKKEGHGFGLHSGALAARELGGTLAVRSDGPGKGATFILELPVQPSKNDS